MTSSERDTNSRKQTAGSAFGTAGVVCHALRLLLGGIFLYASYDKILHPQAFTEAVYNYQILPDHLVNLTALVLPWLELLLGLCLIAGVWLPGTILISTGLLTIFVAALVFNQIRGLDIHCGCFSTETSEGPAGILTVIRDLFFWAISIYLTIFIFSRNARRNSMSSRQFFALIILGLLFCPFLAWAGERGSQEPDAYLPETVYEFQPVLEGNKVVHDFILHNRGQAELSVLKLKSG